MSVSVYNFFNTNHRARWTEFDDEIQITDEQWKKELADSEKSGLIPDLEHDIYVREGYGALVGICPNNCSTLEQLFNYSKYDMNRKIAGKPTLLSFLSEVLDRISYVPGCGFFFRDSNDYYGYKKKSEKEGMDLVIGPGGYIQGYYWEKGVYCQNYKQLLGINRENNTKKKRLLQKQPNFSIKANE